MKKYFNRNTIISQAFILGMAVSLFIKVFYLQYTIGLSQVPFKDNMLIHRLLLFSSLTVVMFIALAFQRKAIYFFIEFNIIFSALLLLDTLYGRYYGIPLTIPIVYQLGFVNDIQDSANTLFKWKDIVYFVDLPFIVGYAFYFRKYLFEKNTRHKNIIYLVIFLMSIGLFQTQANDIDRTLHNYERKNIAKDLGVLYFHGYDIIDFTRNKFLTSLSMNESEKKIITEYLNDNPRKDETYNLYSEKKNLLIIQVEALQEFVIDLEINGEEVTPFLNCLKSENLYFSQIYHQVAGGNTADSEFLLNVGLYPTPTGSVNYLYPTNRWLSLSELLNEKGYTSLAFHGYEASFWNRQAVFRNLGFYEFISKEEFEVDEIIGWSISDESFFRQSIDRSLNHQPFYSLLITLSSHHPYDAFSKFPMDVTPFENSQIGSYLKGVNYADQAIKGLFQRLADEGILEDTIVVIYGDHSGLYLDQKVDVLELLSLEDHPAEWVKIQKVPLIFALPDKKLKGNIDKVGGQIDILPTLVDILGLDHPFLLGNSLLREKGDYAVKRDGSIYFEDYYFDNSRGVLYNIETLEEVIVTDDLAARIEKCKRDLMVSDIIIRKNLFNNDEFLSIIDSR
ncbi:MAG: LTA synthase family protein [Eubacteriales bacterium]|nr:LTA synthase family protein [Eubacteriales bacterium]